MLDYEVSIEYRKIFFFHLKPKIKEKANKRNSYRKINFPLFLLIDIFFISKNSI